MFHVHRLHGRRCRCVFQRIITNRRIDAVDRVELCNFPPHWATPPGVGECTLGQCYVEIVDSLAIALEETFGS